MTLEGRIWLVRHAEAQPAVPGERDIERPLTLHGEAQCRQVRKWLDTRQINWRATEILFSPARRTRETANLLFSGIATLPLRQESTLWRAELEQLHRLVNLRNRDLILIGHNPTIEQLAIALSGRMLSMHTGAAIEFRVDEEGRFWLAAEFQPDSDRR